MSVLCNNITLLNLFASTCNIQKAESDKESFSFMRAAADEGHAKAMYNLGLMFTHGKGVGVDERKAARWFGNAANEGLACAQFELSLRYRNGVGIDQNLRRANSWHRKAISQVCLKNKHTELKQFGA